MKNKRLRLCIVGQSGSGLLSIGEIVARALRDMGFYVVADREYPSLIKGGHSCFTINVSSQPIRALEKNCDVLVSIDKPSLLAYFDRLVEGGVWVHGYERLGGIKDLSELAAERNIQIHNLPTRQLAKEIGGMELLQNTVLVGMVWRVLELPWPALKAEIERKFGKKPKLLPANFACAEAGFKGIKIDPFVYKHRLPKPLKNKNWVLEPLQAKHTQEDFEVVAQERDYLNEHPNRPITRCFTWPGTELDLVQNQRDLEQHEAEFQAQTDFAYIIRSRKGDYLGCVYVCVKSWATTVYFWMRESYRDLEASFYEDCLAWLDSKWDLQNVVFPGWTERRIFIDGNQAVALGAIHGGVQAYYAYPMSPSSSILTHMANYAAEAGILVKQAEDEITVANLSLGSWYAGARSLCATSGGGFDLMTETVSLSGITEVPWVCVLVQRPGPATGLPTWTAQGDLNIAIYGGHGEYGRMVLAVSDPTQGFETIQKALNAAEKYQIPVVVLSEKVVAETLLTVEPFTENTIPIERHLQTGRALEGLQSEDRYALTESGISKRWIPGSKASAYYFANGDEHDAMGRLDESESAGDMIEKRVRKLQTIKAELPEPELYGVDRRAQISFVGYGSTKGVMLDVMDRLSQQGIRVNYLHYDYIYPLQTAALERFMKQNKNVVVMENNTTGQFADLVQKEMGISVPNRHLKWNGRPFFVEEVEAYILKKLRK